MIPHCNAYTYMYKVQIDHYKEMQQVWFLHIPCYHAMHICVLYLSIYIPRKSILYIAGLSGSECTYTCMYICNCGYTCNYKHNNYVLCTYVDMCLYVYLRSSDIMWVTSKCPTVIVSYITNVANCCK